MRPPRPPLRLAVLALLAGACGGDAAPTMDAAVAEDLATRADALAAGLEAGDTCAALETAGALVTTASARRDAGEVPTAIAAEVIATTRDTVRGLTCDPQPAPEPQPAAPSDEDPDDDRGEGKGEEKGEGKGDGKGKDDDPRWGERDDDDDRGDR